MLSQPQVINFDDDDDENEIKEGEIADLSLSSNHKNNRKMHQSLQVTNQLI